MAIKESSNLIGQKQILVDQIFFPNNSNNLSFLIMFSVVIPPQNQPTLPQRSLGKYGIG